MKKQHNDVMMLAGIGAIALAGYWFLFRQKSPPPGYTGFNEFTGEPVGYTGGSGSGCSYKIGDAVQLWNYYGQGQSINGHIQSITSDGRYEVFIDAWGTTAPPVGCDDLTPGQHA